jgi:esterase/lipase superfamily enzyme
MKQASRWYSDRIEQPITLVRWGHWGAPVLLFPTAGGDAEEAERMHAVGVLWPLIEAGRIKVYSLDSLAGRSLAAGWGSEEYRCWLLNGFEEMVAREIVPAIHADCGGPQPVIVAGASIGAFTAVAVIARYPELFRAAIAMSGTYDLERLLGFQGTSDYYFSAPLSFLGNLGEGDQLDRLRRRFVLMAYGQGRWEDPGESWSMANLLGAKGVPNRVDVWGPEWDHDWPTWRRMLPLYLDELTR